MRPERQLALDSVVGGLVLEVIFTEPDLLALVLQPGVLGSKKARSNTPIRLECAGVSNAERVKQFFFGRRVRKPFGEWQDQVVGVASRTGSVGIAFAHAGRVRVQATAYTITAIED